jgi:D-lactate dehydrogenase
MMKVAYFSAKPYDIEAFREDHPRHDIQFFTESLNAETAKLANGSDALCVSPNDKVNDLIIRNLTPGKPSLIVVRSSGFDNIDFQAAQRHQITVKWLPGFAPHAIAEHAVALLLSLNRKTPQAFENVNRGDFSCKGMMGFNLYGKTVGIIGLGRIGTTFARIMIGFGCKIITFDPSSKTDLNSSDFIHVSLKELFRQSDIISLHCDLNEFSAGIVSRAALQSVKPNLVLINTARGQLVDTQAVIDALTEHRISGYGADVYENEGDIFYYKFDSLDKAGDPLLASLIKQPNVLLTPHLGFLTVESMQQAARTILNELTYYENLTNGSSDRLMI